MMFFSIFYNLVTIQEFMEARRTAGLNNAPPCLWSSSPPQELEGAPDQALSANAGFVSFGISYLSWHATQFYMYSMN